jgi:ketosteroid isomerase-like protein
MMRHLLIPLALGILVVAGGHAQSKDHDAVADAGRRFAAAFETCNVGAINAMVTDDMQFIHSDGRIQGKAEFAGEVAGCALAKLQVEVSKVRMYGDAAILQGVFQFTTKKGQPGKLLISEVFVRRNGNWLFASHQSTPAPRPAP